MLCGVASAGFTEISVGLPEQGPPQGAGPPDWVQGPPEFVVELLPDQAVAALVDVFENFGGEGSLPLEITGMTDEDPVMTVTKEVTNNSGYDWTGFEIALPDGGVNTFVNVASSDIMTLDSQSDYLLVFTEPSPVLQGQTVTFTLDILVPTTGPFGFTLDQTPIPEPATMSLMGLGGALALLRRRRT
jgi:hypothetical protein